VVEEHVTLQGAHEQECARSRISHVHRARLVGAGEVSGEQQKRTARGRVLCRRIKRQLQRRPHRILAHGYDDPRREDARDERYDLLGDTAEDDSRIRLRVDVRELQDRDRRIERLARGHRLSEQSLFRFDAAENRGRCHAKRRPDFRERRLLEPAGGENTPSLFEDL